MSVSKGAGVSMETCSGFRLAQATSKHSEKYFGNI